MSEAVPVVVRTPAGRLLDASAALVALGSPVAVLALAVRHGTEPLVALDGQAVRTATDYTVRSGLAGALVALQTVTEPVVLYALAAGVVVRVARAAPERRRAAWAFGTMMASWAAGAGIKVLVARPRPVLEVPLAHAAGYGFPSGHALNATVAGSTLLILLWPRLTRARRRVGVLAASLGVVVVGLDRVLLGVHHPSDVVGGVGLGVCLVTTSWAAVRPPRTPAVGHRLGAEPTRSS